MPSVSAFRQPRWAPILVLATGIGVLAGLRTHGAQRTAAMPAPLAAAEPSEAGARPSTSASAVRPPVAAAGPVAAVGERTRAPLDRIAARLRRMLARPHERAPDLRELLDELRAHGSAAVPVIAAILRRGSDVDLAARGDAAAVGDRTLRQALLHALLSIGGNAATTAALEVLHRTREPVEVAMLARGLDTDAPGEHTDAVLQAIGDTLRWAVDARATPDVGPLFELLRGLGGERAVTLLRRSVPQWGEYAVIALAGMPDEGGIPALADLVATPDLGIENRALPFQLLAQASAESGMAAEALRDLARADRIPEDAWPAIGDALGGKHLQFSRAMFDGTSLAQPLPADGASPASAWRSYYIEWMNVRYEQDVVSVGWTATQIERQAALIDELAAATSSPLAVQALQRARASLPL